MRFAQKIRGKILSYANLTSLCFLAAVLGGCGSPSIVMPAPVIVSCESYKQLAPEDDERIAGAIDALDDQIKSAIRVGTISPLAPLIGPLLEWRKHSLGAATCHKMDMTPVAAAEL